MRIINQPDHGAPLKSGSLHLRIAGFGGASAATDMIVQALRAVPAFHLAGLREIEYAPEDAPGLASGVLAAYVQRERCVRFYRLPAPTLLEHVLHHEIGHHVLALVVSSKVRSLWVNRIARRSAAASRYGLTRISPKVMRAIWGRR